MYFVYSKTINIASEYNYDTRDIINYFIDYYNPIEYFNEYGVDSTPSDFVAYIFETSEDWFESFAHYIVLEKNLVDMISDGELDIDTLIEQISDTISSELETYYDQHWDEFKKEYLEEASK